MLNKEIISQLKEAEILPQKSKVETINGDFPLTAHISISENSSVFFAPVYRGDKIAYFQAVSIKLYDDTFKKSWEYTDENMFKAALAMYDKAYSVREKSEKETETLGNAMARRITAYMQEANKWSSKGDQKKKLRDWYAEASKGLEGKRFNFIQQMAIGIA